MSHIDPTEGFRPPGTTSESAATPANDNTPPEASHRALADAIRRDDRRELNRLMRAMKLDAQVMA